MISPLVEEVLLHVLLGCIAVSFICLYQAKLLRRPRLPRLVQLSAKLRQRADEHDANTQTQDDIEYPPPRPAERDVLGGAGSYAALGARLLSPAPDQSRTVGWIVDEGSDFPPAVAGLIGSWSTSALVRRDPARLTTRGWNGYAADGETRAFRYTTPKRRLVASDLAGSPLLRARAFHMVCSPSRCRELVTDLLALRRAEEDPPPRPVIVWEPVPDLCTPEELLNLTNCLPLVDVCSPNHAELAAFMGDTGVDAETGEVSAAAVERACEQLLGSMPLSSFALVVRAGEQGCYVAKNGGRRRAAGPIKGTKRKRIEVGHHGGLQPDTDMMSLFAGLLQQSDPGGDGGEEMYSFIREEDNEVEIDPGLDRWLPAFWTKEDAGRVVDPTGGGNTFLGGMALALARGKCMEEAACWGSVAASFAIEQVGVPALGKDDQGEETWNGVRVEDRLREFHERIRWSAD